MTPRGFAVRRALPGLLAVALTAAGSHTLAPLQSPPPVAPAPVAPGATDAPATPAARSSLGVSSVARAVAPAARARPRASSAIPFPHRAGEALVVAAPGRLDEVVAAAARALGARSLGRVGSGDVVRLALPRGADLPTALARLRALPGVEDAGPNALTRGASWPDPGMMVRVMNSGLWNLVAARWTPGDARGVTVAVLDTGLAYRDHVDARGVARARAPWLDGVMVVSPHDALHGDDSPDDANNHGTHLASMLVGLPAMAPGAALMPVQVLGEDLAGTEAALIDGLDWARTHGAQVVNLSLAFERGYHPSRALDRAVAAALRAGVVLVAAAGNGGDDDVRFPAAFPGVLAVGAGALDGPATAPMAPARYATTGAALDLLAPGGDLARDADRNGVPDGVVGVTFDPEAPTRFAPWLFAGSSQAALHASAAAARLLAHGVAARDVVGRLRATARPLARGRGFDATTGAGSLDMAAMSQQVRAPSPVAVQLVASLVRRGGGAGVVAGVAVRGRDGEARRGHTVHARWRGAVDRAAACVTDRDGVCWLDGGALPAGTARVALLEVQAVVDRDGAMDRPDEVFWHDAELVPAAAALEAGGEAMLLWRVPAGATVIPGETTLDTLLLRGIAPGTALAPTVVALDAPALDVALGDPSGTGFGRSSIDTLVFSYDFHWFVAAPDSLWLAGAGFGRSSTSDDLFFSSYWSWGYWGELSAFSDAWYTPEMVLGAAQSTRATSVGTVRGAGEAMPLP